MTTSYTTRIDCGCDTSVVGHGWRVFGKSSGAQATVRAHLGGTEQLEMVNAATLLLDSQTKEPVGMLICYDVFYYESRYEESLISTCQAERTGITVNAQQRSCGHEQNLIFADGRILNLECDGKGFWLYNKSPTGAEIEYWQKRPESCYLLTAKGSHDVGTAMP